MIMAASGSTRPTLPHSSLLPGVDALDPYGAFVALMPDGTGSLAPQGVLGGVSLAVKDLLVFGDRVPYCGLSSIPFHDLGPSSPVVARLVEAGASLAGFTTLTALAYEPSGVNHDGTRPLNPWHRDAVCGGSSSGSAVAVAAGLVDLAVGSDTAGSLRIPAQCSGVTSWKPTFGLLSLEGVMPLAPSLDCLGFMARDTGLLDRVAGLFAPEGQEVTRVAVAFDLIDGCQPEIAAMFERTLRMVQSLSIDTDNVEVRPLLARADGPVFQLLQGEACRSFAPLFDQDILPPDLAKRLQKGASVSEADLVQARDVLGGLQEEWSGTLFAGHDCLLLPVMPVTTPTVTTCTQGHPDFAPRLLYALSEFTRFVNGLGWPAVAVPMGIDARGWPMAMQLVGLKGSDRALLSLAGRLQALRGDLDGPVSTSSEHAGKIAT
jgi:Asp-tRNA(Asn)/Glu-tRNA(Gln) amidotransferase A subunit family amidase